MSNEQSIQLRRQFDRFDKKYGFGEAKKIFIPIMDSILRQRKYMTDDKIDTTLLFSQIDSAVTNKINSDRHNFKELIR